MDIRKLLEDNNGTFPAYAWPGGYPIFYIDVEGAALCPKCATKLQEDVKHSDVNWEDGSLTCEECGKKIESAYGED